MTKFKTSLKSSILSRTLSEPQYEKSDEMYAQLPESAANVWTSRPFHGFKASNVTSLADENNSLSQSGMDLTTSVSNEYRDDRFERRKMSNDCGQVINGMQNGMHGGHMENANINYHMYLNEMSKDMIIRNPVQIPSSLPTATPVSANYAQRPIWNTVNHHHHLSSNSLPPAMATSPDSVANPMLVDTPPSTLVLPTLKKRKRTPQPIPEECKDGAYWERRKRNNESAKRSREMRRVKEQQTNMRVLFLEQDNLRLKTEVTMLKKEVEKLHSLLCSRKDENKLIQ